MDSKIESVRRTLYESIPQQVRGNMRAAFDRAAQESGTGMKARIISILSRRASEVSEVMFDDAERSILQGVRGLNDWLSRKYAEMEGTVTRHAGTAAENLTAGDEQISPDRIQRDRGILSNLGKTTDSLIVGETAAFASRR